MKTIGRLLCVALAISMLCASALAEIELIPQSKTMYLNSRDGKGFAATREIDISGINADSKITEPKSSKPSVLKIDHLTFSTEQTVLYEGEKAEHNKATLSVRLNKPGKSTVSVNVDGVTYKTKLKVAQYVNPVKKFVISGISGKNLKSRLIPQAPQTQSWLPTQRQDRSCLQWRTAGESRKPVLSPSMKPSFTRGKPA